MTNGAQNLGHTGHEFVKFVYGHCKVQGFPRPALPPSPVASWNLQVPKITTLNNVGLLKLVEQALAMTETALKGWNSDRTGFMGMQTTQSHRTLSTEGPGAWFTALLILCWKFQ